MDLSNGAHPDELNDGIHGASSAVTPEALGRMQDATVEYDLGLGANATGYDITSITIDRVLEWRGVR